MTADVTAYLEKGVGHHRAQQLVEAEVQYRQALALVPDHVDAAHLLGLLLTQTGRRTKGIALIRQALARQPNFPGAWLSLGNALMKGGALEEAAEAFRSAIALAPDNRDALTNLSAVLERLGRPEEARAVLEQAAPPAHPGKTAPGKTAEVAAALEKGVGHHRAQQLVEAEVQYRQALALAPDDVDAAHLLGLLLTQTGRRSKGIALIRQALARQPNFPGAWLSLGNALMEAGVLEEAAEAFRSAAALVPDYVDALANLGAALRQLGRTDEAIAALERAVEADPAAVASLANLGNLLQSQGRFRDAARRYLQALVQQPDHAEIYYNLGLACGRMDKLDEAIAAYRAAITHRPDFPEALTSLGACLRQRGDLAEAERMLLRALALRPRDAASLDHLATIRQQQGRTVEALDLYQQALAAAPEDARILFNLGTLLESLKQEDEALEIYRHAIAVNPQLAEAHYNIGVILTNRGQREAANDCYRRAIAAKPEMGLAWLNLGVNLHMLTRCAEAIETLRRALELMPDSPDVRLNLGLVLLQDGQFAEGFEFFEWRWEVGDYPTYKRNFPQPLWGGESFAGRTLLVHAEQGYGDSLQFCRFLPQAAARGGRLVLELPTALVPLFDQPDILARLGVAQLVERDRPLPPFDLQVPVLSLGRALGIERNSLPGPVSYLRAPADRIGSWSRHLPQEPGLKVGLVWAGSPTHRNDNRRSLPLDRLAPLAAATASGPIRFYSLQKGPAEAQLKHWCGAFPILAIGQAAGDFADLAAIMSGLDLIISVDSAPAHLAGALGRPVWTLLPFCSDWRWLLGTDRSPWYPGMTLYRQSAAEDWSEVVDRVAADLAALAAG